MNPDRNAMRPVDSWLSDEQLAEIYSSAYWKDAEKEREKDCFWIVNGSYQRCLNNLEQSGLLNEYREAEKFIAAISGDSIKIADLAAGIGWASALLSKLPNVSEVHAVELSQHRLGDLFEQSVRMMDGEGKKLHRHLGIFYELMFENESFDLVLLSQAFHHADQPLTLLNECDRILKADGSFILIGEHYIGVYRIIIRFLCVLIKERRLVWTFHELFPTDHDSGDHYYRVSDYEFMFRIMGYQLDYRILRNGNVIYIAKKSARNLYNTKGVGKCRES